MLEIIGLVLSRKMKFWTVNSVFGFCVLVLLFRGSSETTIPPTTLGLQDESVSSMQTTERPVETSPEASTKAILSTAEASTTTTVVPPTSAESTTAPPTTTTTTIDQSAITSTQLPPSEVPQSPTTQNVPTNENITSTSSPVTETPTRNSNPTSPVTGDLIQDNSSPPESELSSGDQKSTTGSPLETTGSPMSTTRSIIKGEDASATQVDVMETTSSVPTTPTLSTTTESMLGDQPLGDTLDKNEESTPVMNVASSTQSPMTMSSEATTQMTSTVDSVTTTSNPLPSTVNVTTTKPTEPPKISCNLVGTLQCNGDALKCFGNGRVECPDSKENSTNLKNDSQEMMMPVLCNMSESLECEYNFTSEKCTGNAECKAVVLEVERALSGLEDWSIAMIVVLAVLAVCLILVLVYVVVSSRKSSIFEVC